MLGEAARAAPHFPRTQIVVNHAGCPRTAAKEACAPGARRWRGWRGWRAQPNVTIKISGIGEAGGRWRLEANRRVVLEGDELFGVERCMFGSNYPVDSRVVPGDIRRLCRLRVGVQRGRAGTAVGR
jgi:predicted TIM-barrel fold metal-dependent hydrolase